MAADIEWEGASGRKYGYWIHPIGTEFKDEPGNYIFAEQSRPGYWVPKYIGQTESLRDRLGAHEKEACARRNGATHIHAHTTSGGKQARLAEEGDLLAKWDTPCNG